MPNSVANGNQPHVILSLMAKRHYTPRGTPTAERFIGRVDKSAAAPCWLWTGCVNDHGYGMFKLGERGVTASRAAHILFIGPVPRGIQVCHRCDNPRCVRPSHLFLGTAKENAADSMAKGRRTRVSGRRAKLTPEQRIEIRERRGRESLGQLAHAFGVSRTAILKIAGRRQS